ncbi:fur family transcriptional regulator [Enterococcus phoeniculicola]|jgi:Fur family zinc uptake transcriptional regulator|uniref:Fur family transcriptional regulator n=1 Tax=Enterococcus phoeniculicola ATCC BAA-412 TaxID=1158610 RepID=R3TKZ7_9ENTE|nr:Fur family transcriptional regulator [Enterococcus phoeniculicola]EOL42119.1 fur family transcriptional regulator [Enterococcus phoeniculicola ATCC BAA-412]EOT79602.1 fur family transcriptional regulator [Enterococcus phoeniculicola ATCC BAA-412]OJG71665.1 fur family transcriptional regulator [Enterococcus phoeniculicola]
MNNQTLIQQSLDCLKENGLKYTKKREALLTYLIKRNRYVSAREVHEFMQEDFPGLSYDTIYRNLHDFSELDLLEETDLNGEMKFRFHCCQGNVGHHHHFICTVCGKTKEIHMCPMNFFEEQLSGCTIEGHRFEILGRCEECQ